MKSSKFKNKVWTFFKKNPDSSATCKLCNKNLRTSGNTSNLLCHVENVHKQTLPRTQSDDNDECCAEVIPHSLPKQRKIYEIISTPKDSSSTAKTTALSSGSSEVYEIINQSERSIPEYPSSSSTTSMSGNKTKYQTANKSLSQPNVKDFFEQVKSISTKDGRRSKKLTEAIVNFIIMDNKPFYAVEGKAFLQLMKELVPLYKVPSRETVKLRVDEKYEALSCAFKEYIRKSDTYCLTYDIWTEQLKNESFMGVTIHFLDNLHLLSGTLGLIELCESHTAAYLGEKLSRLFI
ncbi:uncharacterized protein LOC129250054 [Anastrepha obliqua]|uniref:uncharacterized protein LOC129250054 n=1 Tax=Anastrepha obliqua TaxID=95512 RepID=UPI00240A0600|nr:uncharacterized protein LOC129250054 [Anastrepha obliqua]